MQYNLIRLEVKWAYVAVLNTLLNKPHYDQDNNAYVKDDSPAIIEMLVKIANKKVNAAKIEGYLDEMDELELVRRDGRNVYVRKIVSIFLEKGSFLFFNRYEGVFMYQLLIKTFVRDYKNTEDAHVREQYGTVCSIISIVCNIVLVVFKLIFGTLVHSVSIVADGYNNLSDAGSNIATFFGFKLANKHPDAEHPYGHGRFEYITGLGISF